MNILGIIPSRLASTRFPGKPLVDIGGKSMIQRVYEQCKQSILLTDVIIATDDLKIQEHALRFGGEVTMTSSHHQSGTDRCAEVAQAHPHYDVYINIQGDEPFIDPEQIDLLCRCFQQPNLQIATLIKKINSVVDLANPNTPKVTIDKNHQAIYFSRAAIPFFKGEKIEKWLERHTYYKHIGIYGYSKQALLAIAQLPPSSLEKVEGLEQLRWIENGYSILTAITDQESHAIDLPEDLKKISKLLSKKKFNYLKIHSINR